MPWELIPPGVNVDFVGSRRWAMLLSGCLIVAGLVSLALHGGPNYGIDFTGGTIVQVRVPPGTTARRIRAALRESGLPLVTVQQFAGQREFLLRLNPTPGQLGAISERVRRALRERVGQVEVRRVETVGPKVGRDLRRKGTWAVIWALVGILLYVAWRFELRYAVGAVVALVHDVLITLGAFSITGKPVDLPVVAAFLTIVGYSLNDTIVVFDRIRENLRARPREPLERLVNRSINETLSRTIITSGTTLLAVLSLFFLGGGVIHDFAFALLVGVLVGTYSSIYIASPLVLAWEDLRRRRKRA